MNEQNQNNMATRIQDIDYYCLIMDYLKNLWVIVIGAIAIALLVNVYTNYNSRTSYTYTTKATFVVSTRGTANKVYNNLSSAQSMATTLSNVLNSNIIRKKVCEDLNIASFDARATARVIDETNLLELKVTAKNAKLSYQIIRSIMKNYPEIIDTVIGSTMMETLQEPSVPLRPDVMVNIRSITIKGFIAGIAIMLLLVGIVSCANDTIKNSKDLSNKLDADALGTIYFERKNKSLSERRKRKKKSILISNPTTSFGFEESIKKIAVKLAYRKKEGKGLVINVTSVLENEGKSTVCANLALAYARNKNRVVLVDCDLRKPSQMLIFEKQDVIKHELKEVIDRSSTLSDTIIKQQDRNLWFLLSSKYYSDCSEIIGNKNMSKLVDYLRQNFDYIILDSPPLSVSSDAEILANHADACALIVKHNLVQARDINDAIDELSACKAEFAGCILNQARTFRRPGSKGYGYGYGYGYGNYYNNDKK